MSAVTGFAIISFVLAYLAINTPDRHGPLQIANYFLAYLTILFTAILAYSVEATGENPAQLITQYSTGFSWMPYFMGAYFLIYIIVRALRDVREK